jgi:hypothetical protein
MTFSDAYSNPVNLCLSACSTAIAFVTSTIDPVITGIAMPLIFFIAGKGIDVAVRIYLARKEQEAEEKEEQ